MHKRTTSKKKSDVHDGWSSQYPDSPLPRKFPTVYPTVASIIEPHAMAAGQFIGSRPQGVTVHYTANDSVAGTVKELNAEKLGYHLIIDRDGKVTQTCYLDRRVNHAGDALWRELSPNRWHAAVAIVNWGLLQKGGKTWTGVPLPAEEIVTRPSNIDGKSALWHAATTKQEASLLMVLRWFMAFGLDPRNIAGHDECALPAGRKSDPGGSLSWTMEDLRHALCSEAGVPVPS